MPAGDMVWPKEIRVGVTDARLRRPELETVLSQLREKLLDVGD